LEGLRKKFISRGFEKKLDIHYLYLSIVMKLSDCNGFWGGLKKLGV